MTFIKDHSDEAFVHELFGPVAGIQAQKARRHDEVLGSPSQAIKSAAEAEMLAHSMKTYVDAVLDKIGVVMKGKKVRDDGRAVVEGVLSRSHGILDGGSGTGKTLLCELIAEATDFPYERIDGQADLTDVQILGIEIPVGGEFQLRRGLILQPAIIAQVDEWGRITPSAGNGLLQALENRSVMIGTLRNSGQSRVDLSPAFTAMATKNPNNYLGSSGDNEALLDRISFARRMSIPDHEELVQMLQCAAFHRTRIAPEPLPATLYQIWSAIEFVEISPPMIEAIIRANYFASPPDYCATTGWSSVGRFEPNRRQKSEIVQLQKDTTQYLSEGSNPRGMKFTALRAKANAFFRGAMVVTVEDVRRAAEEALLFRLKPYPGTNLQIVADIIQRSLDLTLPS